jgi:ribosomal protein L21E
VQAAKKSPSELVKYLSSYYNGNKVTLAAAPFNQDVAENKRFFL